MKTITIFSIKHFALFALFTIALMLTNAVIAQAQTDTNEAEFANTILVPVPLKICSVAGQGVAVGTPFTFTITTSGSGTTGVFTSTRTILTGPAATGPGMQNGNCDFVAGPFTDLDGVAGGAIINGNGSFNVGSMVTVQQTNVANSITTTINSPMSPIVVTAATRSATITIINGINEVFFVNASIASTVVFDDFGIQKKRKRMRFF